MASQTHGIQQLLAAEKKADAKVNQARKLKAQRLKQAKDDAQAEVLQFKAEREKQFKEYEARFLGSREDSAAKIEQDTHKRIELMNKTVGQNKGKVTNYLITQVFDVKPKLHQNLRLDTL